MITKNSKKTKISKIIARDKEDRDIPNGVFSQLEEHTEGYVLFYMRDGKLCVTEDGEPSDAKRLGMRIMAKDYLKTVIKDSKDSQEAGVLSAIDGF